MSNPRHSRPLSPFMLGTYYRFQNSSVLSLLHRLTGIALTIGLVPLAAWIWSVGYSAELFQCLNGLFTSILGKLALFGWTVAFFYHLGNGIRHLNWDLGRGLKLEEAKASGQVVVVFALAASAFTWTLIIRKVGM